MTTEETETETGGRLPETEDTARRLPDAGPAGRHPRDALGLPHPEEASIRIPPGVSSHEEDIVALHHLLELIATCPLLLEGVAGGLATVHLSDDEDHEVRCLGDRVRDREGDSALDHEVPYADRDREPLLTSDVLVLPGSGHLPLAMADATALQVLVEPALPGTDDPLGLRTDQKTARPDLQLKPLCQNPVISRDWIKPRPPLLHDPK